MKNPYVMNYEFIMVIIVCSVIILSACGFVDHTIASRDLIQNEYTYTTYALKAFCFIFVFKLCSVAWDYFLEKNK